MKTLDIKSKIKSLGVLGLLLIGFACTPEDEDLSLGQKAEAAFTVEAIEGMRNTYQLRSTAESAFIYKWDLGDGEEPFSGTQIDTAFFENKGAYTITLTVVSEGGYSTTTQNIEVKNDAVTGTSAINAGNMEVDSAWTFTVSGTAETNYEFIDGALTITNGNPSQGGVAIWQAVELKGGRAYVFDADMKGAGMTNSWVEVILLDEAPEEGSDPSGTAFTGLHTWTGCGSTAFESALSDISCLGDGKVNIAEDGTYYIVIKVGSWDGYLGDGGVTIDNIEFVAQERLTEGDNILEGSDMETPAAWNIANMGATLTTLEFTDGVMKFTNGTTSVQTNIGVWQAVEVEAGQIYKMKADVNDPGSTSSWQEFYVSTTAPEDGTDYSTGRIYVGNTISFAESGTVYVVIKVGSWDGNLAAEGVTIDNVELVEMN
ncbi:hypothetical protein GCM10011506_46570 [Marivirga lumbricoides]|uniref:PKD domain-containing protein n=1 Tax=Marivirga lumbricoides TaxID=1046115 RepID=A0ABQ1N6L7_9BACT|nr:hypothetical protein GCM10011506_46570 [Marivirga lumbricoides]